MSLFDFDQMRTPDNPLPALIHSARKGDGSVRRARLAQQTIEVFLVVADDIGIHVPFAPAVGAARMHMHGSA